MRTPTVVAALVATLAATLLLVTSRADTAEPKRGELLLLNRSISPGELQKRLDRYVPMELGVQDSAIPADVKPMLAHLRAAADRIDRLYWDQVSAEGWEMRTALRRTARFSKTADAENFARFLEIHYGPWDRYADDATFLGRKVRPPGGGFYPEDISKRELDEWVRKDPGAASGLYNPYAVVRRGDKALVSVPYSKAYATLLGEAARALTAAAQTYKCAEPASVAPAAAEPTPEPKGGKPKRGKRGKRDQPPAAPEASAAPLASPPVHCKCAALADFLKARARSFTDDSYLTSEVLWLESRDCPLDIAIGPYEYYEDRLLGLKTSFEAIVYLRDDTESARFRRFLKHNDGMVKNLPIPEELRSRFELIKPSPITIGNVLYTSGDARSGYQIRAFVLPNDESVRRARGTKNVILKNVVKAKFEALARPVAKRIFSNKLYNKVSFDAYYDILMAWQFAHGVVPGTIELPDGTRTTARQQLRERHSLMELVMGEAIALLNYSYLRDNGELKGRSDEGMAATFLASFFDSARLGAASPQTVAKAIIYNYLAREWVFRYDAPSQTFEVNAPNMVPAVRKLTAEVMQVMARGDYAGAGNLIIQFGILPGEVRAKLSELSDLPVAILPKYTSMPDE